MFQFNGFNMMFPDHTRPFNTTYKCYSVSMLPGNERQDVENGGKIIMPPSALDQLTRLNVVYPMLFKLTNGKINRSTHAGVLEFVADEGKIYIPYWMMHNLLLEEGDIVEIESVSIPVATYSKFEPQSVEFLDITNPKAVLENCLRNFACLTTGDLIAIKYNNTTYELSVLETKPGPAVTIIECDMNVEFAPPVGYKEPERKEKEEEPMTIDPTELMPEPTGFVAFKGEGTRLDGKKKKDNCASDAVPVQRQNYVRGIPDYDHPFGLLRFDRSVRKAELSEPKPDEDQFREFQGEGFSLKKSRK
ncbi:ubiquitin fusion degradation protein 1 homolog [Anopheles bellator]|uniref:ubiquitin fusion degradation protein 1 homolog n=1 Tax=Anopheles bellator TaxID=139047 RepID=UPI0026485DD2|nr:ubiquitin fusion degradation protein 1 homolog [Anopheles bellator]